MTFGTGISDDDKSDFCNRISDDDKTGLELAMMIKLSFCIRISVVIKCLKISDDDKTDLGLAMMIKLTFVKNRRDNEKMS